MYEKGKNVITYNKEFYIKLAEKDEIPLSTVYHFKERGRNPLLQLALLLGMHILHFRASDRGTALNKPGMSQ